MKKLLLLCVFVFIGTHLSFADDICVAQNTTKADDFMYSKVYHVRCTNTAFEAGLLFSFGMFLPPPIGWEKKGLNKLHDMMSSKGYVEVAQFPAVRNTAEEFSSLHIFEREPTQASYCSALKYNVATAGLQAKEVRFDVIVSCERSKSEDRFNAITEDELTEYMARFGYGKALDVEFKESWHDGPDNAWKNADQLEIYKSNAAR